MPRELIGLIPAAGHARRLDGLPCSKEIFPIGFEPSADGSSRPRPVVYGLLRGMAAAGVERAIVVLRDGKWDIPSRLGDGAEVGLDLSYLLVDGSRSVPETLDRASAWTRGHDVALGFPDILLEPADVWPRLVDFHRRRGADVSLGLFPTDQSWKADMVEVDAEGRIGQIVIKDPACTFLWTWSIAVLSPAFVELMQALVEGSSEGSGDGLADPGSGSGGGATELYVGDVVRAAIEAGLDVRGLPFDDGRFLDIGTPEDLRRAVAEAAEKGAGVGESGV